MAHGVGQRLLSHPEAGRLDGRLHAPKLRVREKLDVQPAGLRLLVKVAAQRWHQPQVVQERRPQLQREFSHLLQQPLNNGQAIAQPAHDGVALL
jgi:hypothetical protein